MGDSVVCPNTLGIVEGYHQKRCPYGTIIREWTSYWCGDAWGTRMKAKVMTHKEYLELDFSDNHGCNVAGRFIPCLNTS